MHSRNSAKYLEQNNPFSMNLLFSYFNEYLCTENQWVSNFLSKEEKFKKQLHDRL